ncbi:MAG TPA: single-stranded DNA-binding protein [Trinickia sp.]|uniref:single-stranded DNA-binding protein n=1 Tax=Trinickia sp. TaxID=2571163 RepID=UPI002C650FAA|nr:single-stranded DNA-binding protein [Trinickia sp.]HVW50826.1 single-stranded DNA-binding protein [Trinickia sp.]
MIDALVGGKLWKQAERRRSTSGNDYVVAKVRAADGDGEGQFISVIAFSHSAQEALLALDDGDSVSLAGTLKIGTYETREGVKPSVSMTAHRVLTAYHVTRTRKAVAESAESPPVHSGLKPAEALHDNGMDDDL